MITYMHKGLKPFCITVKLDGRVAGSIKRDADGFYYYEPRGSKIKGETFSTIEAMKRSIEGRDQ